MDKIGRTGRRECGRAREDMKGKEWKGEGIHFLFTLETIVFLFHVLIAT